jgi:Uma2 family endonuclease
MVAMVLSSPLPTSSLQVTWQELPADFVLPDDPVENLQQPALAAALTDALGQAGRIPPEALLGTNFALVATVSGKTIVKAPDWFYIPRAYPVDPQVIRRSYTPYLQGEGVAVVMEFLSETEGGELSVRSTFPYGKLYFYEQILQVPVYVTFDPYVPSLEVRRLDQGRYQLETADANGRFWLPPLDLWLGVWPGTYQQLTGHWLRWWDGAGQLLPWSSEQAEQERQRAEQERQRAEQEHQRAEQEHQRAEQERQRAEQEHQRAERLAAALRDRGIDPNSL